MELSLNKKSCHGDDDNGCLCFSGGKQSIHWADSLSEIEWHPNCLQLASSHEKLFFYFTPLLICPILSHSLSMIYAQTHTQNATFYFCFIHALVEK
jgi:hypothetical protein